MKTYNTNLPKFTDLDNLIDYNLYHALVSEQDSKLCNSKEKNGIYIMKTKKFDNNTIIYNYLYFNEMFIKSILAYIKTRLNSYSHLKRECGDYTIYIDSKEIDLKVYGFKDNDRFVLNNVDTRQDIALMDYSDVISLYRTLLNTNINIDSDDIVYYVDQLYRNNICDIFDSLFGKDHNYQINANYIKDFINKDHNLDYHLLDNSIFIIKDMKKFVSRIEDKGYVINQGVQSKRGEISNISNFLSYWALDYRSSLYAHHVSQVEQGNWSRKYKLDRKMFSYRNINMKLSGVRYYSTNESTLSNIGRQKFIENNYRIITDILESNYNVGNEKVQLKIEEKLYNQETRFAQDNLSKSRLNFSDKAFKYMEESKNNIEKLMKRLIETNESVDTSYKIKKSTKKKTIKNTDDTNYGDWVLKMIKTIKVNKVTILLLEYFMRVLTIESIEQDDVITPGIPLMESFEEFGQKMVNEYINTLHKSSEENRLMTYSQYKNANKEAFNVFSEDVFNAKLGAHFIHSLIETGMLVQELDKKANPSSSKTRNAETEYYLRIPLDVRSIMMMSDQLIYHLPQKLPMVCEPKDYIYSNNLDNNKLGGYLLNDDYYDDEIFKSKRGYGVSTVLKDDNKVVSLINGLSKTPYRVNKETLNFIWEYGIEKGIVLDDQEEDLQRFIRNPYKNMSIKDRKALMSKRSTAILERNVLNIAYCFSEVERIYFPVRLDQRTRLYCETNYFDYQKNDLAKGLISFAEPGTICKTWTESINYFKAFGANMYGNGMDKKSLNYRVKWIDNNMDYILNFRENDIINNAENKTCFVSFCFEYEKFIEFMDSMDKTVFYTHLPIQLDASCNGFQHLALLTKEFNLFDKLNLSGSSYDDEPNDFYSYILRKTQTFIKDKIYYLSNIHNITDKDKDSLDSYKLLDTVNFDRSVVKKVIMTKSYNAGLTKQIDQIKSVLTPETQEYWEDDKKKTRTMFSYKNPNILVSRSDLAKFVLSLRAVLDNESPKVKELSDYLYNIVRICTKLDTSVPWVLPSGAEIRESYLKRKKLPQLKSFNFLKTKFTFQKYVKDSIDIRKQWRATMPNLIHSLDASTIAMLYDNLHNKKCIYTVHDCFATTANNVPHLIDMLKLTYLDLYSNNDYLKQFDMFVKTTINSIFGNKVYELYGKYVYVTVKGRADEIDMIPFPDVNKVLKKDALYKSNQKVDNLRDSSYLLI